MSGIYRAACFRLVPMCMSSSSVIVPAAVTAVISEEPADINRRREAACDLGEGSIMRAHLQFTGASKYSNTKFVVRTIKFRLLGNGITPQHQCPHSCRLNPAGHLSDHQLDDSRVGGPVPGEGGEPESGLRGQLAVVALAAPLAAKVHEEQIHGAHHLRRRLGDDLLRDQHARVRRRGGADLAQDVDDVLVGPVVEHAADVVDECACGGRGVVSICLRISLPSLQSPGKRAWVGREGVEIE